MATRLTGLSWQSSEAVLVDVAGGYAIGYLLLSALLGSSMIDLPTYYLFLVSGLIPSFFAASLLPERIFGVSS